MDIESRYTFRLALVNGLSPTIYPYGNPGKLPLVTTTTPQSFSLLTDQAIGLTLNVLVVIDRVNKVTDSELTAHCMCLEPKSAV